MFLAYSIPEMPVKHCNSDAEYNAAIGSGAGRPKVVDFFAEWLVS